jgi:pimeloyl-ACP methyl ester carboxylesterase
MADCASDVRAICAALGIDRLAMWGLSGGGPGIEGSWDDCVAQLTPWGFDLAQISIPVLLLHGGQDRAVPFSHGQWLASRIPGAETWFFADEGHALRESHIEDVHAWLVARSS